MDYGQKAGRHERSAALKVARHFQIPLKYVKCSGVRSKHKGFIQGRNAFLVLTALMEMRAPKGILALGVHAGTPYYDCGPNFIRGLQSIVDGYTNGTVQLSAPFLRWKKNDIWEFCHEVGVPLELTYSCERGSRQPCGACLSCRDLEALYARS